MKVCLECGRPATHRFFARRVGRNGAFVPNLWPGGRGDLRWPDDGWDHLRHDRYRFICRECGPAVRERLRGEGFEVGPPEGLGPMEVQ